MSDVSACGHLAPFQVMKGKAGEQIMGEAIGAGAAPLGE
jgi:hypothetical protein